MIRRSLAGAALALAALLPARVAVAQDGSRDFVCSYFLDHDASMLFVGRQVVEVRTQSQFNNGLDVDAETQIRQRVLGMYDRDDIVAYGSGGGYRNIGLAQTVIRKTLGETKERCLEIIADFRNKGFTVYGVGNPVFEAHYEGETAVTHYFLSSLEYGDYQPGTIATRKRNGDDTRASANQPRRDSEGWKQGERAEYYRESFERGQRLVAEGDSLYDEQEYAAAKQKYRALMVIGVPAYEQFQPHAQEQLDKIARNEGMQSYAAFTRATGLAFGVQGEQSYFERDAMLMGFTVARRTFGLRAFYGIATGSTSIHDAIVAPDSTQAERTGEHTKYALNVGAAIPFLHVGDFGLHAGYVYQKTDLRALHLGMVGVHMGTRGGTMFRFDVTPVYGKPMFGASIIFDLSDDL